MDRADTYKRHIANCRARVLELKKKKNRFTLLRLAVIILGAFGIYQAVQYSSFSGWLAFFAVIVLFSLLVRRDNKNDHAINHLREIQSIYENELSLSGERNLFGNGAEYREANHDYSNDLDLFGKFSLFNFLNRTVTEPGSKLLSGWLKSASRKEQIIKRQEALKELSSKRKFKEAFLSSFFIDPKKKEGHTFVKWMNAFSPSLIKKKSLKPIIYLLPAITLGLFTASFFYPSLWTVFTLDLFVNYMLLSRYNNDVDLIHHHLENRGKEFLKFSRLVDCIQDESFETTLNKELQEQLLNQYNVSGELRQISRLTKRLENRNNLLIAFPLNLFFFWEVHLATTIEKWFERNGKNVEHWLKITGNFDALLSLSILHYNYPEWTFPSVSEEYFILEAVESGHPLIPEKERVNNDYSIKSEREIDILTGSNMAGKSTFLRTVGVNIVLALAGAPVCAKTFRTSVCRVMTYMRTRDDLAEKTSSFYAELKRIRKILKEVEKGEKCFLLLDELLKGTNSKDRHTGSVALIKQLLKHRVAGMVATHDLGLTEIEKDLPGKIANYHFDVSVKEGELFFDYKIKKGICKSFNASLLMKKIGIEVETDESTSI